VGATRPEETGNDDQTRAKELGRPRRYEPETERSMLVKATRRLLRRQPYDEVTLAAILAESNLHTRALYRHFATKDDLLLSIYQDNAQELHDILSGKVDAASSPADAVLAWIDEMLRLQFDPRAVAHVSFFREPAARDAMQRLGAAEASLSLLLDPLERALAAGLEDGSFPIAVPHVHAAFISVLIWDAVPVVPGRGRDERRTAARDLLVDFVMRGLGQESGPPPPRPGGKRRG